MRIAKTIDDLIDLFGDYNVVISLTDENKIIFEFPFTNEEKKYSNNRNRIDYLKAIYSYENLPKKDPIRFSRQTRYTIRSLVENPRFGRLTTVADQLSRFCLYNKENNNKEYGQIKAKKRKNEPLHLVFENNKYAKKFFSKLSKNNRFKII